MPLPLSLGESTPLANQVAGHEGVMSDASGSLVIKPALPREIAFYQMLNSASREDSIRQLKPFIPKFFGTLRLEGQLSSSGDLQKAEGKEQVPESVVIENLSYAFAHPNILDVKLGTVLYGPDASEEKKSRMDKQARETTTHETGIRLTGCQTWHSPTQKYIITPKSFGKSISSSQLPSGMIRFFPLPSDSISSLVVPPSPAPTTASTTGAGESHLPSIAESSSSHAVDSTTEIPLTPLSADQSSESYSNHAITPSLLVKVLDLVLLEINNLITVLSELEIRFVGGSVLIVYEGDPAKLSESIDRYEAKKAIKALKATESPRLETQRSAFSDDGSVDSNDDESTSDADDDEEDEDEDDGIDDGTKEDEKLMKKCPPVRVKMIDFAHTWLAEGEGPDQGVLKGLNTLKGLIESRKKEVEST
ncbi:uncharacterized protein IL334_005794 [Kwoniella shivajii]|uniref:Kinase n=1 Tax=Kwoniella shivajii TaxID=564305 RepID=A0ABZ1D446_9TREE|nr:hypothetical protein IL334_005794 [Kwoniella shivajii]